MRPARRLRPRDQGNVALHEHLLNLDGVPAAVLARLAVFWRPDWRFSPRVRVGAAARLSVVRGPSATRRRASRSTVDRCLPPDLQAAEGQRRIGAARGIRLGRERRQMNRAEAGRHTVTSATVRFPDAAARQNLDSLAGALGKLANQRGAATRSAAGHWSGCASRPADQRLQRRKRPAPREGGWNTVCRRLTHAIPRAPGNARRRFSPFLSQHTETMPSAPCASASIGIPPHGGESRANSRIRPPGAESSARSGSRVLARARVASPAGVRRHHQFPAQLDPIRPAGSASAQSSAEQKTASIRRSGMPA